MNYYSLQSGYDVFKKNILAGAVFKKAAKGAQSVTLRCSQSRAGLGFTQDIKSARQFSALELCPHTLRPYISQYLLNDKQFLIKCTELFQHTL